MTETMRQKIEASPFQNVYWFSRYLLNTDQYGALGKNKEAQMLRTVSHIEPLLTQANGETLSASKALLAEEIQAMTVTGTKAAVLTQNLLAKLEEDLQTVEDLAVFCITMKHIVAPINHAIAAVPSDDEEFCRKSAASILDTLGEQCAGKVISTWDSLGVKGCLDAERAILVKEFQKLTDTLSHLQVIPHSQLDDHLILTAFVQEFERRLGQKRKARGGNSLENAVSFLFDYYKIPSTEAPSHFDQDLEVDKWYRCRDGWSIGISCKRTLRERWKQVSQADRGTLSHFKIKELWHIITFDHDLSDDKIVRLGEQGQIFYLMDNSETYKRCSRHIGMKHYIRPLSGFIGDIRTNVSGKT